MTQTELPAVAKSFYTQCKKCEAERYHTVLAHKTARSAKVKCEVCGAQSTYSLPKAGGASKAKTPGATVGKGRGRNSESARRASHVAEYEMLLQQNDTNPTQSYNMKGKFEQHHKLQHPKFGLGVIRNIQPDRIEVVFQDEIRSLIHNRP